MSKLQDTIRDLNNNSLTNVFLNGNQIGDTGAKALAEALAVNTSLTNVDLRSNSIGDTGAKALAEALAVNTSLMNMCLYGNQIGDTGAKALAEALAVNTSLTNMDLNGNQIGNAGAKALVEVLAVNTSLTNVYLRSNQIANAFSRTIGEYVTRNALKARLKAESERIAKIQEELQKVITKAEQQVSELQAELQTARTRAEQQVSRLQAELQTAITQAEQQVSGLQAELQTAITKAEQQASEFQAEQEISGLQAELQTAITKAEQQASEFQAEQEISELQAELQTAQKKLDRIEEIEQLKLNEQSIKDIEKKDKELAVLEERTHSYCLEEVTELLSAQIANKAAINIDIEVLDLPGSQLSENHENQVKDLIKVVLDENKVKAIALYLGNNAYAGMLIRKQEDILQVIYVDPKGNSYIKEKNVQALINKINEINEGETKITDLKVMQQEATADSGAITVENLVLLTNPLNIAKLSNLASLKELLPRMQEVEVIRMKHLLTKETNPYYSSLKMQKLLEIELQDQEVKIFPVAVFEDKKLFAAIIQNAVRELIDNSKPVIIPVRDEANHWAGIVIKKQVDEGLQAIYSDPSGRTLMQAKHSGILFKILASSNLPFHMFDLQKKQQINDNDDECGVFTIENLVQLSTNETYSLDITRMKALLPEQDVMGNNGHILRAKQVKKLNDAGIPTESVQLSRGTLGLEESQRANVDNDGNKDLKSRDCIDFARNPVLESANDSNNSNAREIVMDFTTIDISITGDDAAQ